MSHVCRGCGKCAVKEEMIEKLIKDSVKQEYIDKRKKWKRIVGGCSVMVSVPIPRIGG